MTEQTPPQVKEDPQAQQRATERGDREAEIYVASQWKLVWWRFRKHRLAVVGTVIVLLIYLIALFAEFVAPFTPGAVDADYTYAPPQRLHFFDDDGFGLYVYGYRSEMNEETLVRTFVLDESTKIPVRLFASGNEYRMWGLFETDLHLLGPVEMGEPMYLLGANDQGQDMLSRIIFGARVSMSIGLVGVALSFVFGVFLGGISGYYAG